MSTPNRIIDKVRKILELAARAGTPEEGAAAAARAQEIMLRYKLERADVEAASPGAAADDPIEDDVLVRVKYADPWLGTLALGVAKAFDCEVYWWGKEEGTKPLKIVGRRSDLQAAMYVYEYLRLTILRLFEEGWSKAQFTPDGAMAGKWKWGNSFRVGAAGAVQKRLFAHKAEQEASLRRSAGSLASANVRSLRGSTDTDGDEQRALAVTGTTALAIIQKDQREVKAKVIAITGGRLRRGSASSPKLGASGYRAGVEAGNRVDLGLGRSNRALT